MIEFEATIVRLPGKIAWPVFYVPDSFTAGTKGRINVLAKVDESEYRCTLLPSSRGHYLVYNKEMKEHGRKDVGDMVQVELEKDDQPRELVIPEELAAILQENAVAAEKFNSFPYYIRREEINKIEAAKTLPTREKRLQALLDRLTN